MTLYLGRPGGTMTAIPTPNSGLDVTAQRTSSARITIGGRRAVDYAPGALRTWQADWPAITPADFGTLESWHQGQMGPGPYALLDTTRVNHLAAGQAAPGSSGDVLAAVHSTESLAVVIAPVVQGASALRWTMPRSLARGGGILTLTHQSCAGIPWPAAEAAYLSLLVQGGGADPQLSVAAALGWLRADGSLICHMTGTPVTTGAGVWSELTATATPPPAAVYCAPSLLVDPTSVSAGGSGAGAWPLSSSLLRRGAGVLRSGVIAAAPALSDWVFGQDVLLTVGRAQLATTAGAAWHPGTGVPLVTWSELSDQVIAAGWHAASATLLEV